MNTLILRLVALLWTVCVVVLLVVGEYFEADQSLALAAMFLIISWFVDEA